MSRPNLKSLQRRPLASRRTARPVSSNDDYRVGPGRPPRQYQFKPGQSGNPEGARKRQPSIAPDLKLLLQAALSKKIKLTIGEKERLLTKAAAGIEQLVDQFARGERHARRDLFDLADKLDLDLGSGSKAAIEELVGKEDEVIVDGFLERNAGKRPGADHPPHSNDIREKPQRKE